MPKPTYIAGRAVAIGFGEPNTGAHADVQHFEAGDVVPKAHTLSGMKGLVANAYLIPSDQYTDYQDTADTVEFAQALAADIPEDALAADEADEEAGP